MFSYISSKGDYMMKEGTIRIIPLGGLGEIGKNITAIEYEDEIIVIDCGIAFPDEDMYGVDLIIPDITYLVNNRKKVKGFFLTHGHEDHIGALPYILKQLNVPVYGTKLTLGLVKSKLEEHNILNESTLINVEAGDMVAFDKIKIEFIRVTHSIADSCALAIYTEVGTILHTGDFKIDYTPIDGKVIDLQRISNLGNEGVLLLMADSTNVEIPGYSPSEKSIEKTLNTLFANSKGRIIVATFASNIHRIQQIIDANVAIIILPLVFPNILVKLSPTILSDFVYPCFSTFVESAIITNTPFLPSSANLAKSINSPSIGV